MSTIIMSKSDALKAILSLGKKLRKTESEIQNLCKTAVYYSVVHGDITLGQKLVEVVSHHFRPPVAAFLEAFGQFEWKSSQKTLVYRKNEELFELYHEDEDAGSEYVNGIKVLWHSLKQQQPVSLFDCEKKVLSLLKSMETAIKDAQTEGRPVANIEIYDFLSDAIESYKEAKENEEFETEESDTSLASIPTLAAVA